MYGHIYRSKCAVASDEHVKRCIAVNKFRTTSDGQQFEEQAKIKLISVAKLRNKSVRKLMAEKLRERFIWREDTDEEDVSIGCLHAHKLILL